MPTPLNDICLLNYPVRESPFVPRSQAKVQLHPACDPRGLWCTPEFRTQMNQWLKDFLGVDECAWKIGDTVFVHPEVMKRLRPEGLY